MYHKEQDYNVIEVAQLDPTQTYYVHVLGSGYTLDERLYPSQMLSLTALARLTEGIRIYRAHPNIKLVLSGPSKRGIASQAFIAKKAAIELGIKPNDVYILEEPTTTSEEVEAFVDRFGKDVRLIVCSDATHLPRAVKMFQDKGLQAMPAPTNFIIKEDINHTIQFELPNSKSFEIANFYFLAKTKEWYYAITGR